MWTCFKTITVCILATNYLYSSHLKHIPNFSQDPSKIIFHYSIMFRLMDQISKSKSDPGQMKFVRYSYSWYEDLWSRDMFSAFSAHTFLPNVWNIYGDRGMDNFYWYIHFKKMAKKSYITVIGPYIQVHDGSSFIKTESYSLYSLEVFLFVFPVVLGFDSWVLGSALWQAVLYSIFIDKAWQLMS